MEERKWGERREKTGREKMEERKENIERVYWILVLGISTFILLVRFDHRRFSHHSFPS
jgi:uncharacterized membrane protein